MKRSEESVETIYPETPIYRFEIVEKMKRTELMK